MVIIIVEKIIWDFNGIVFLAEDLLAENVVFVTARIGRHAIDRDFPRFFCFLPSTSEVVFVICVTVAVRENIWNMHILELFE